jgi:hypothetical protein
VSITDKFVEIDARMDFFGNKVSDNSPCEPTSRQVIPYCTRLETNISIFAKKFAKMMNPVTKILEEICAQLRSTVSSIVDKQSCE